MNFWRDFKSTLRNIKNPENAAGVLNGRLPGRDVVWVAVLGILAACFFHTYVNRFATFLGPETTVTVTVQAADSETAEKPTVYIYSDGSAYELFQECKEGVDENWIYTEGEAGVSWTAIASGCEKAAIHFTAKAAPGRYILFYVHGGGGKVNIDGGGYGKV